MELENPGTEIETQVVETPEVAPETAAQPLEGAGLPPVEAAPPPYQPNTTYKVKGQEKKFDDWLVPVVKDPETEKKVRELLEKRDGLEYVKQDRESLYRENTQLKQTYQQKYQPMEETVQQLIHFRDQGNLPAFLKLAGIPLEQVVKFSAQYVNMDPHARQQLEQSAHMGLEAYGAQRQSQSAEQQAIQQAAEFKSREFELISRYDPQVSQAVSEFDQQHGPGSFFEQVRRTGLYHYQTRGVDISVQDAVSEVLRLYGRPPQGQPSAQQAPALPGQAAAQPNMVSTPQAPTPKPVIPGFQGSGTSPVKKVISSFADARKRARELESND